MDDMSAYQEAFSFETPMRVVSTDLHGGRLPVCGSFVAVEPAEFGVTAIKQAEDGSPFDGAGWLVRGYNLTGEEIRVTLKPWQPFQKIQQLRLDETEIASLNAGRDGKVSLPVRGHEIVTVRFVVNP